MKKFVFLYYGGADHSNMNDEDKKAMMDKWMAWFGTFKDKQVDGGNPFGPGMAVTSEGSSEIAADMWPAKGYTIINAESMDEATEIASKCPIQGEGNGAQVRVYEAMPM